MGGLADASFLSVVWAMFAAAAGVGLLVAAIALFRRTQEGDYDFAAGYNALAPLTDR
jgi:hypothetical protein